MLGRIKSIGFEVYDFVIGDDWWMAAGVVIGLALTYALSHGPGISSWWPVPVLLIALLPLSLWKAVRKR